MVEANLEAGTAGNSSGDGPLVTAARGVERGVERTVEKAKEGLEKAKGGIEKAKDGVGHAKEKVTEQAARAKEGVKELPNKTIGELADSVTDYAKEHPGQTILVSLGVGALIGMLLSRR
jgi:ElaB/YqjD/DUF883 family membrane-anchored ribosome-binding protein